MAATPSSATVIARRPPSASPTTPQRPTHRPTGARAHRASDVGTGEAPIELVAAGIAVHSFTEPLRTAIRITPAELHRATTVLTKQVVTALGGDDRLRAVLRLVTDPTRPAGVDGRTAEQLAQAGWTMVRSVAEQRAHAAIDGALAFGETAILRVAATRAATPDARDWGTPGWADAVARWAAATGADHRLVARLLHVPETASDAALTAVLDR